MGSGAVHDDDDSNNNDSDDEDGSLVTQIGPSAWSKPWPETRFSFPLHFPDAQMQDSDYIE